MTTRAPLFSKLSSKTIAERIRNAHERICIIAPGIQTEVAHAIVSRASKFDQPITLNISLDFNEQTLRMGYGDIKAVKLLKEHNIEVMQSAGFRSAVLIVDNQGWVYTPTALLLEPEPHSEETPNAIRLNAEQIREILLRVSPQARAQAIEDAETTEVAHEIADIPQETGESPIETEHFEKVQAEINKAPLLEFDLARQVRVYNSYLQYVELALEGAKITTMKVTIPSSILGLGNAGNMENRLKTTFDLIQNSSELSSKKLDDKLSEIRKIFTSSLGKHHGRCVLKQHKPELERRLSEFRSDLEKHQKRVAINLQDEINQSMEDVVEYYLPFAKKNPPESLIYRVIELNDDTLKDWLRGELQPAFPTAEKLIKNMKLEVTYKDVTFESLNSEDFLEQVKEAFPGVNWAKAHDEFTAAREA